MATLALHRSVIGKIPGGGSFRFIQVLIAPLTFLWGVRGAIRSDQLRSLFKGHARICFAQECPTYLPQEGKRGELGLGCNDPSTNLKAPTTLWRFFGLPIG